MNHNRAFKGMEAFADARIVGNLAGGPASKSYLIERDAERFVLRLDTGVAAALEARQENGSRSIGNRRADRARTHAGDGRSGAGHHGDAVY